MKKLLIFCLVLSGFFVQKNCADGQGGFANFLPNHSLGENYMPPDEAYGAFNPGQGAPSGLPFGMPPGAIPAGAEQDFYGEIAGALSESLKTPEGLAEFKRMTGETLGTLMSDPEIIKNNPELQQMQEALANDPKALDGLIETFQNVMADPEESKKLFQAFDSFASKNGFFDQGQQQDLSAEDEPFYDEEFDDVSGLYDPQPLKEVKTEPKLDAQSGPKEPTVALSALELKNEWKTILLDRKAALNARKAAFGQMVRDFDKAYSNLYRLKNSYDPQDDHLGEKIRSKLDRFIVGKNGLSDYAAMIWTAASDDFATAFFIENFSNKGQFLEQLVAFDQAVKELSKIAKKASIQRRESDEKSSQDDSPSPLTTDYEKEVNLRIDNLNTTLSDQGAGSIIQTMDAEFSRNPKLQALLNQKREQSKSPGQKDQSSKKDRWGGNNYQGSDYPPRGQNYDYDGANSGKYPYYGSGNNGYGSQYSNNDFDSKLKDKSPGEDAARGSSPGKRGERETRGVFGEDEKDSKGLLSLLVTVGKSLPDADPEGFFAKVEAVYSMLEAKSDSLEELTKLFGKEEKKQETVGGLTLKDDAQNKEAKNQNSDEQKAATLKKKENLILAAQGVQKCKMMLETEYAFPIKKQKNTPSKLLQGPRPAFYADPKLGILDGFGLSADKSGKAGLNLKSAQELSQGIENLQKVVEANQAFYASRAKDLNKIEKNLSDNKITPPMGVQAKLARSLSDFVKNLVDGINSPSAEELLVLESFDLNNDETVKKFLIEPDGAKIFESLIKNLNEFYALAIKHRVICPFNGIKAVSTKIIEVLDLYEAFSERLASPDFAGSFYRIEEKIKNGQNKSQLLKDFLKSEQATKNDGNLKAVLASVFAFLELHKRVCVLWSFKFDPAYQIGDLAQNLSQATGEQRPSQEELAQAMEALQKAQSGGFLSNAWMMLKYLFSSLFSTPYNWLFGKKAEQKKPAGKPKPQVGQATPLTQAMELPANN